MIEKFYMIHEIFLCRKVYMIEILDFDFVNGHNFFRQHNFFPWSKILEPNMMQSFACVESFMV